MPVLICPNAFKESLTAADAAAAIRSGLLRARPALETRLLPLSDGGDGFADAIIAATGGAMRRLVVEDALGRPIEAAYGVTPTGVAIIEIAAAAGLARLTPEERDAGRASSFGAGQLLRHALDAGHTEILIGLGGSATTDGGAGLAQALGWRLRDASGTELARGGAALRQLHHLIAPPARAQHARIRVACDVDNPLHGPRGAAHVYAPQKGASPGTVGELDAALMQFDACLQRGLGLQLARIPGAGAAGGLGAGLMAFAGATLEKGLDLVAEITGLDAAIAQATLVITGEGRVDAQTASGKVPAGVAARAHRAGVPCVVLAGAIEEGADALLEAGVSGLFSICPAPMPLDQALESAAELLEATSYRIAHFLHRAGVIE